MRVPVIMRVELPHPLGYRGQKFFPVLQSILWRSLIKWGEEGVKRPQNEADHSPPSSAIPLESRNAGISFFEEM
jgi:hypothetical protein